MTLYSTTPTMKSKFLTLMLCTVSCIAHAQVEPQVDLATGTMNLSIPLWNIQDHGLQFPLTLTYTANGVRVTDVPGWVGQNWSLSAEAAVSRIVRGLPDDFSGSGSDTRKGWLHGDMGVRIKNFTISTDNDPNTCGDEVANWNFLNGFGHNEDTEPDLYNVDVFGLSFQFYFDENEQVQVVSYQDVKVETLLDINTGLINGFSIVDEAGIKYMFQDGERIQEDITSAPLKEYYFKRLAELYNDPVSYFNVWKLSKIISPVQGEIDFTYKEIIVDNPLKAPTKRKLPDGNMSGYLSPLSVKNHYNNSSEDVLTYSRTFTRKVLEKISSTTTDLEFTTVPRDGDGTLDEKLDMIKIYERRLPGRKFIKQIDFAYKEFYTYEATDEIIWYEIVTDVRSFLESVTEETATQSMPPYDFQYYGVEDDRTILPHPHETGKQDNWGFYRQSPPAGSIRKLITPQGSSSVFFYDKHDFVDSEDLVSAGGGIRIRKIITHAGVASQSDNIREFEYLKSDGVTSGKLLFNPLYDLNTVKASQIYGDPDVSYRFMQLQQGGGSVKKYFEVSASHDLASNEMVHASNVAYKRVTVKQSGAGKKVYEFDLPAMYGETSANEGEWEASYVALARNATGSSVCYERGEIPVGINVFPFPPHANYSYARALLTGVIDIDEDGHTVKETTYEFQRLFRDGIGKKIYGLSLEELPTYYYDGSSEVNSKMFLFSKYPVNTNVKTVLKKETVKLYNVPSQTEKFEHSVSYYYESPDHPDLTKVVNTNSDQSQDITRFKYVRDYVIDNPTDNASAAMTRLLSENRNPVIESITSRITGGVEKFIKGGLSLYQEVGDNVFPYQAYSFQSSGGLSNFVNSSILSPGGNSIFQYDQVNYRLNKTFLSYDEDGNLAESEDINRQPVSVAFGYDNTLPVVVADNGRLNEVAFSDFETLSPTEFTLWASPVFSTGRTGIQSLTIPGGSGYKMTKTINNNRRSGYIFSCWIKAGTSGSLNIHVKNSGTDVITPIALPYDTDPDWKYYKVSLTVPATPSTFSVEASTTASVLIDDVAFRPKDTDVVMYTYDLPFGKATETNSRGITTFYSYDEWGRIVVVKDHNRNIVEKNTYQIRP